MFLFSDRIYDCLNAKDMQGCIGNANGMCLLNWKHVFINLEAKNKRKEVNEPCYGKTCTLLGVFL